MHIAGHKNVPTNIETQILTSFRVSCVIIKNQLTQATIKPKMKYIQKPIIN